METLKLTCENYTLSLDEKERELVKSLQALRAEEWQKQHAFENTSTYSFTKSCSQLHGDVSSWLSSVQY